MGRHLVFGEAGLEEFHAFPVCGIADCTDHAHALVFIHILDGSCLHHGCHAVDPVDLRILEDLDDVDIDEIDAELRSGDAALFHFLQDRIRELRDLLERSRARRAFDPCVRPADVLLGDPWRMARDVRAEVALLEQHRRVVTAQQRVAQSRLQPVPAGGKRARHVADVLVVHEKHRAQPMGLHALPRPVQTVIAQPIPVDPLLPVQAHHAEIRHRSSE